MIRETGVGFSDKGGAKKCVGEHGVTGKRSIKSKERKKGRHGTKSQVTHEQKKKKERGGRKRG